MLTFWDFLTSPTGQELTHAFVVLILAIATYLTYLAHRQVKANAERLDDHIAEHDVDAFTTSRGSDPRTP
jgi:hypothetical protein